MKIKSILIVLSSILIILLSIYFVKQNYQNQKNEIKSDIKIPISRFMIEESVAPIQHVAAGLFSLPAIFQNNKNVIDNFILPNKEIVYAESFYQQNSFGDIKVFIYKRITNYPEKTNSGFHILFKTINQEDKWYEININGALTGFGIGDEVIFWSNPPYGQDRFNDIVSVERYKENQLWTDDILKSMLIKYYHIVTPFVIDDTIVTNKCYRATGIFYYSYQRYVNNVLYLTILDNNGELSNLTSDMNSINYYYPYKAPWREPDYFNKK